MSAIAVAMSGGVDSSVAAALLAGSGGPVIGLSMRLAAGDGGRCCSTQDFLDARRVADRLGIPHYVLDMERDFEEEVLRPFAADYAAGRTPSPCVRCNTGLKFGRLLARARMAGAERVATGHYAVLERDPRSGRTLLRRAADRDKDQSYFLFDLTGDQRARAELPLGRLSKDEVRARARDLGLATADKPESMDLCFVPRGGGYRDVLEGRGLLGPRRGGTIVDGAGRVLGAHAGIEGFTVGQRRGLGIAAPRPLYVTALRPQTGTVVVGPEEDLLRQELTVSGVRWIPFDRPGGPVRCTVRIRSTHPGAAATVTDGVDGTARVVFDAPQRAVAPGQAAVFDDGDLVLGGGWIE